MRYQRRVAAIGLIAASALVLSACGSDENAGGGGVSAAPGVTCGGKPDLRSSGSSAQNNAMTRFVATYQQTCQGQTLNYTPSGSGAGRNEFLGGQTDFAGSDSALKDGDETTRAQQRCASPAWNLPLVFGPVAIAYNVPGVTDLVLDGPTAARVFNGQIATWNDPAIAALNPGKQLPAAADRRELPFRRVGHHRELPEVPGRRLQRRVRQGGRPDVQRRCRRRCPRQPGRRRRHQEHPELGDLRRVVVRPARRARHGADHQRRRRSGRCR